MKYNYKMKAIYILFFLYAAVFSFVNYKYDSNLITYFIHPIIITLFFLYAIYVLNLPNQIIKNEKAKLQGIFIIIFSYLIIYFLSGLVIGYTFSIYSHSFVSVIKNIWAYIYPVLGIEYLRNIFSKDSKMFLLNIIVFTLIDISLYDFLISKNNFYELFQGVLSVLFVSIVNNILLLYISKNCGYKSTLIYLIPQKIFLILIPFYPATNWYFITVFYTVLPFITYAYINTVIQNNDYVLNLRKNKKAKFLKAIMPIFLIIMFAFFVNGFLMYKPTVILSDSMQPIFSRGDILIIKTLSTKEKNNLKLYDIISYNADNINVTHRIVSIEKYNDGSVLYITKGDSNNTMDKNKVEASKIEGVVKLVIPKLGYPAVWVNDRKSAN